MRASIFILIAAFSYPLGNRKMLVHCKEEQLSTTQRVFGMTLMSVPFEMACLQGISFSCRNPFGTFTTETWFPKYFEYTFMGFMLRNTLKALVDKGYAFIESAFDSLDHINATMKKPFSKKKGVAGLSKMKAAGFEPSFG